VTKSTSTSRSDVDIVLRVLRRRRWPIVLCVLLASGAALGFSLLAQKQYTATATLLFHPSQPSDTLNNSSPPAVDISDRDAATNQQLVNLYSMSEATSAALLAQYPHLTPGTVRRDVIVSGEGTSNVVDISATTPTPQLSATIANTYARQFIAARLKAARTAYAEAQRLVQAQLRPTRSLSPPERRTLLTQSRQLRLLEVMQTGNAELAQRAAVPDTPSSPLTKRNTAIGFALGLILGFALALLLERLDRRIKDIDDLEATVKLPVLGVVSENSDLRTTRSNQPAGKLKMPRETEEFGLLRARIRYASVDREPGILVIVSAAPGDGKTTIARNLALAYASAGSSVLFVEADLRQPDAAGQLGIVRWPGISEVLIEGMPLADAVQTVEFEQDAGTTVKLDVLAAGRLLPPNPTQVIESQGMESLLLEAKERYGLVIVDTPPLAAVPDAFPLLPRADGVIVVTRLGQTRRDVVARLRETLASANAPLIGVVANGYRARRGGPYAYGYGQYAGGHMATPGDEIDATTNGTGPDGVVTRDPDPSHPPRARVRAAGGTRATPPK
jgi:capsular exopolysaccharide synthesis family protein